MTLNLHHNLLVRAHGNAAAACRHVDPHPRTPRPPGPRSGRVGGWPPWSDCSSADARAFITAGAGAPCLLSISSNVRPLGSNPNAQNPITPTIYHAAK